MIAPEEKTPHDDADRHAGDWIDGDLEAHVPGSGSVSGSARDATSSETMEPLDPADRQRAAAIQFVHSLLAHVYDREPEKREERIQRVLRAVREADGETARAGPSPRRATPSRSPLLRWSLVASLALAVLIGIYSVKTHRVSAALDRLIEVTEEPVDRTYEISAEFGPEPRARASRVRRPGQNPAEDRRDRPRRGRRAMKRPPPLDGAILHIRGVDQYVLVRSSPESGELITGSNGRESWAIPPSGPVLVSADPRAFRGPFPGGETRIPFVDIHTGLLALRDSYRLEQLPPASLTRDDAVSWHRLRGRKRSTSHEGPGRIEVWYHPETGVVQRLEYEMPRRQHGPTYLAVDLLEERPLGEKWFDHRTHHDPDRPVQHLTPASP